MLDELWVQLIDFGDVILVCSIFIIILLALLMFWRNFERARRVETYFNIRPGFVGIALVPTGLSLFALIVVLRSQYSSSFGLATFLISIGFSCGFIISQYSFRTNSSKTRSQQYNSMIMKHFILKKNLFP